MKDLDFSFSHFKGSGESLFLPQIPLRQKHQFFFGLLPHVFPAGGFDLNLGQGVRGEIPVFLPAVSDKEKLHDCLILTLDWELRQERRNIIEAS
jgi:hypothetical protein